MGMSTHVVGFKPPDDRWQKMKAIWDSCHEAGVMVPREVDTYFGGEDPDPGGVEVDQDVLVTAQALRPWSDEYSQGFEVEVEKIPADVKIIRFYNSW